MTSLRWIGTRAIVGVAAFGSVLLLAQLTLTLLVTAFANVAPYTGS
jgi:hypothetical protein